MASCSESHIRPTSDVIEVTPGAVRRPPGHYYVISELGDSLKVMRTIIALNGGLLLPNEVGRIVPLVMELSSHHGSCSRNRGRIS